MILDDNNNNLSGPITTPSVTTTQRLLQLQSDTGYPIVQNNGQRRFGPPPDWNGVEPPRGSEIFIARIPRHFTELDLLPIFAPIGKIYMLRLMMNFSDTNRGYAFLKYASPELADRAINELDGREVFEYVEVNGKLTQRKTELGVVKSRENNILYISPVPSHVDLSQITATLNENDIENYTAVRLPAEQSADNRTAYIEFTEHKAAALARRRLLPQRNLWGTPSNTVRIDWVIPNDKQNNNNHNNYKHNNNINGHHVNNRNNNLNKVKSNNCSNTGNRRRPNQLKKSVGQLTSVQPIHKTQFNYLPVPTLRMHSNQFAFLTKTRLPINCTDLQLKSHC